jgi:hypothetical protein
LRRGKRRSGGQVKPAQARRAGRVDVVLHHCRSRNTFTSVKTLTVRLPEALAAQIETESRARRISKSDVVRERLAASSRRAAPASFAAIADLIGSVRGLPPDLSGRKKQYLKETGYGRKRHR